MGMTCIDVTRHRDLAQAAGFGDLIVIYFDRVEGEVGGWRCKSCATVFADTVPFGPPAPHECAAYLCANCDQERGVRTVGSHGICPYHFVLTLLPTVKADGCSRCEAPLPPGTVVYAAGPFTLCNDCFAASSAGFAPRVTA